MNWKIDMSDLIKALRRDAKKENYGPLVRMLEDAADEIDRLQRALIRQTENMAFVLNRVDLHKWHGRFASELEEDRKLLR